MSVYGYNLCEWFNIYRAVTQILTKFYVPKCSLLAVLARRSTELGRHYQLHRR